ncbi:MAG: hypothetical protein QG553_299 [Patescibacteria group bacterium]|nr:hypothetical protein [Patescibacteria group bacterium]
MNDQPSLFDPTPPAPSEVPTEMAASATPPAERPEFNDPYREQAARAAGIVASRGEDLAAEQAPVARVDTAEPKPVKPTEQLGPEDMVKGPPKPIGHDTYMRPTKEEIDIGKAGAAAARRLLG